MKFRIIENQTNFLVDTDTLECAEILAKRYHEREPNKYHEIYKVFPDGRCWGVGQWKPGDGPDRRPRDPKGEKRNGEFNG